MFFFAHQWQMCHDFKYFGQHIEIFMKKIIVHVLRIDTIRQTDADPTQSGSGSTAMLFCLCLLSQCRYIDSLYV